MHGRRRVAGVRVGHRNAAHACTSSNSGRIVGCSGLGLHDVPALTPPARTIVQGLFVGNQILEWNLKLCDMISAELMPAHGFMRGMTHIHDINRLLGSNLIAAVNASEFRNFTAITVLCAVPRPRRSQSRQRHQQQPAHALVRRRDLHDANAAATV